MRKMWLEVTTVTRGANVHIMGAKNKRCLVVIQLSTLEDTTNLYLSKKGKNCRWVIIYVIDEILIVTNNFIFDAVLLLSSTDQLSHPYSESINLVCLLLLQIRRLYPGTCCPSTKAYDIGPIHFLVGHHRINVIHPGENVKGSIRKYFLWNN